MNSSSETKKTLRQALLAKRELLADTPKHHYSLALATTLAKRPEFINSQRIAFYWPHQGEIDPSAVMMLAWQLGKKCYLPVLHPLGHKKLYFVEYRLGDKLQKNHYGIQEPCLTHREAIPTWTLNLVLMPVLGFDQWGHRLGRGGGYYDRTFAYAENTYKPTSPVLIGLAYEIQAIDRLPKEAWDIPMLGIATEKRFIIAMDYQRGSHQ